MQLWSCHASDKLRWSPYFGTGSSDAPTIFFFSCSLPCSLTSPCVHGACCMVMYRFQIWRHPPPVSTSRAPTRCRQMQDHLEIAPPDWASLCSKLFSGERLSDIARVRHGIVVLTLRVLCVHSLVQIPHTNPHHDNHAPRRRKDSERARVGVPESSRGAEASPYSFQHPRDARRN